MSAKINEFRRYGAALVLGKKNSALYVTVLAMQVIQI